MQQVGASYLLTLAVVTLLPRDPNDVLGGGESNNIEYLEYLGLQALGFRPTVVNTTEPAQRALRAIETVAVLKLLFRDSLQLLGHNHSGGAEEDDGLFSDYMRAMQMHSLGIRGTAYRQHLSQILHGCLSPIDQDCGSLVGYTAKDTLRMEVAIQTIVANQVQSYMNLVRFNEQLLHNELRQNYDEQYAKQFAFLEALGRSAYGSESPLRCCPVELSRLAGVSIDLCERFLNDFASTPDDYMEEHHAYPIGAHPITQKPILHLDGQFLVPVPQSLLGALRPMFEALLKQDSEVWDKYVQHRAKYLERIATDIFAVALPGSRHWTNVEWNSGTDDSDIDGLVESGNLGVRIQCKSGNVQDSVRRGAPTSTRQALRRLIEDAVQQHSRLSNAIEETGIESLGLEPRQIRALARPIQIEVIVTLEETWVWSTTVSKLRNIGIVPANRSVPWIISLSDLMVMADLLEGSMFVAYVLLRLKIDEGNWIETYQELDWLGAYLDTDVLTDPGYWSSMGIDQFWLGSHTGPIDEWYWSLDGVRTVSTAKPKRQLGSQLSRLVESLETQRPKHWLIGCLSLLAQPSERYEWLSHWFRSFPRRIELDGWSNTTVSRNSDFGLTLYCDYRLDPSVIQVQARDYASEKLLETNIDTWVVIGWGHDGILFVLLLPHNTNYWFRGN